MNYINKKSKLFHTILKASSTPFYLVTCTAVTALMTGEALETLQAYLDAADRVSQQKITIDASSAALLGFETVWTAADVVEYFEAGLA